MIIGMGQYMHKDYAALQDKVVTDGVTRPSYEHRVKENAWMRNMDSKDQAWATRDIFYNFRNDAGEAYSLYNWKNPSANKLTKTGTVTWTSMDGSQGNGTNGRYSTSPWTPDAGPNQAGGNIGLTYDLISGSGYCCGVNRSGIDYYHGSSGSSKLGETNVSTGVVFTNPGAGHWIANKNSANTDQAYKDGVSDAGPVTVADQARPPLAMLLFCRNNNGTAQDFASTKLGYLSSGARIPYPSLFHQSLQFFKA